MIPSPNRSIERNKTNLLHPDRTPVAADPTSRRHVSAELGRGRTRLVASLPLRFPILGTLLGLSLGLTLPSAEASPGSLDPTFDTDGKLTTSFASYQAIAQSVAIQSDGKIVAAGISMLDASTGDFAVARYNTDGSLDPTFGTGGKVTTSFGSSGRDQAWAVAIYKSGPNMGKIVVVGDTTASGPNRFALARYNPDGSLDTSFDGDGKVTTDFRTSPGDISPMAQAFSVALQSDDRIVASGAFFKFYSNGWDFALARYNVDGSLDTSFGGTGKLITNVGAFSSGSGDAATSVAIQSDGRIVAAGYANALAPNNSDFAVARYNTDGTLDTAFGVGGKMTTDFGSVQDYGKSVAIQSDNKIVIAGQVGAYPSADFALARYDANGVLDPTFGAAGKVTTNFGGWDLGEAMALQSDGGIVVAGYTQSASFALDFAVARYLTNGSLDTSFDVDGKVTADFGGGPDVAHAVAIQSDGKIVVAGSGGVSTAFAVARFGGTPPPTNQPPLAVAGPDQVVNEGATVQLDASASSDADNNTLTFDWTVASFTGPAITLSSSTVANPTFSALDDGVYTLWVVVTDGKGGVDSDEVQVTVKNVAPTVNAGPDQSLAFGTLVNISASFADPGAGDTWTYAINWGDGSPVVTGNATVGSPITGSHQYLAAGNQIITVCVTDDDSGQGCDSLSVTFVGGIAKITGGGLRSGNNGRGGFNVQSGDGVTVQGEMEYQHGSVNLHAHSITTLAVSTDRQRGWFAGVLKDGRTFTVYVEDNGEPGKNDIFKIWVEGALLNGAGNLTGGNVQIHR